MRYLFMLVCAIGVLADFPAAAMDQCPPDPCVEIPVCVESRSLLPVVSRLILSGSEKAATVEMARRYLTTLHSCEEISPVCAATFRDGDVLRRH